MCLWMVNHLNPDFCGDAITKYFYFRFPSDCKHTRCIWKIIHKETHSCQFLFLEISHYQSSYLQGATCHYNYIVDFFWQTTKRETRDCTAHTGCTGRLGADFSADTDSCSEVLPGWGVLRPGVGYAYLNTTAICCVVGELHWQVSKWLLWDSIWKLCDSCWVLFKVRQNGKFVFLFPFTYQSVMFDKISKFRDLPKKSFKHFVGCSSNLLFANYVKFPKRALFSFFQGFQIWSFDSTAGKLETKDLQVSVQDLLGGEPVEDCSHHSADDWIYFQRDFSRWAIWSFLGTWKVIQIISFR